MINFNKNKLINSVLTNFYNTFALTLDTSDFVPEKDNEKISKYIFKNMKKAFKKIDKEDRAFQRDYEKKVKLKEKENKCKGGKKYGIFQRKPKANGEEMHN